MRVLVACEESQRVCQAFRDKGHEAYSCDITSCSGGHPEWHIQGDVLEHLNDGWDLMVAHPPCTYMANSGVCWLYNKDGSVNQDRWGKCVDARNFFYALRDAPIEKICIENPIPHKYANLPKYTQIIQPWMFGHTEQKATCLWLKGLPKLHETNNVYDKMMSLPKRERQRIHYIGPGPERQKERSKTFLGIARAFADQWGNL
jgi:hypothetical protein